MKIDINVDGYRTIWNMICDKTNFSKDKYLEKMGLQRIKKTRGKNYFICSFKSSPKKPSKYRFITNLKVIDKEKWFLTKLKHGI